MPDNKITLHINSELKDLIPGFLKTTQERIQTIKENMDENDYRSIAMVSHKMAGTGGGYGFEKITELGKALEQAAKVGDGQKTALLLGELVVYLDRVEIEYVS